MTGESVTEKPIVQHRDTAGKELDFWSFIDFAVKNISRDIPGIDGETMRLVMGLRRATETMFYDLHVMLTKDGSISSTGAMRVLLILYAAGPCRVQDIANYAGMSRAAASSLCDTMEKQGVIIRRFSDQDRRIVIVEATDAGRAAFAAFFQKHNARERQWLDVLSVEEKATLFGLLDKVMEPHRADDTFNKKS